MYMGLSPLHLVLQGGSDTEHVLKMLSAGASVLSNEEGRTPLLWYCMHNVGKSPEIITLLIEAGSNVNQQVRILAMNVYKCL